MQAECIRLSQADSEAAEAFEAQRARLNKRNQGLVQLESSLIKQGLLPPQAAAHRRQHDAIWWQNKQRPSLYAFVHSSAAHAAKAWEEEEIKWLSNTLTAEVSLLFCPFARLTLQDTIRSWMLCLPCLQQS